MFLIVAYILTILGSNVMGSECVFKDGSKVLNLTGVSNITTYNPAELDYYWEYFSPCRNGAGSCNNNSTQPIMALERQDNDPSYCSAWAYWDPDVQPSYHSADDSFVFRYSNGYVDACIPTIFTVGFHCNSNADPYEIINYLRAGCEYTLYLGSKFIQCT